MTNDDPIAAIRALAAPDTEAMVKNERTEFETWVLSNPKLFGMGALTRSGLDPDGYVNSFVKGAWWAWKARAALAAMGVGR